MNHEDLRHQAEAPPVRRGPLDSLPVSCSSRNTKMDRLAFVARATSVGLGAALAQASDFRVALSRRRPFPGRREGRVRRPVGMAPDQGVEDF
jgi:hypothetical protein